MGKVLVVGSGVCADALMRPDWLGGMSGVARLNLDRAGARHGLSGAEVVLFCAGRWDMPQVAELGGWMRSVSPATALMLVADVSSEALAVAALRAGFREYLAWPLSLETFMQALAGIRSSHPASPNQKVTPSTLSPLLGQSEIMHCLRTRIQRLAQADATVLIVGETGTGKDLVARHLHHASQRHDGPCVALNCAALPDSLFESELFGHERGAFTGAHQAYKGKVRLAEGGTLFLDEIGDMPLVAQAKLLRLLENREVFALGASQVCRVDIRLIAATNQQLEQRVEAGLFRQDLYYRLNVARLDLPPLRDHLDDVELLARSVLQELSAHYRCRPCRLDSTALRILSGYHWPGNVRELRNVLESAMLTADGELIYGRDLGRIADNLQMTMQPQTAGTVVEERSLLLHTLNETHWNKSEAAQRLNWSRMTLYRKLAKYDLTPPEGGYREAGV
ncbi:sigma-54 dependent transcriptional regulator [Chitinivorax sp. B]|uniref:sigma-54 interaction domain-containing protein n=1 Tax=Chitinivorax sp. B TaxID=2502235 RepID=UPI002016BD58|nr:sigma-54 dependent transcriptional regulator [Chitinivorax sp. B]